MKSTFKISFACLLLSSGLFAQTMEFRTLNTASTGVKAIQNSGDGLLAGFTYSYDSNTFTPRESYVSTYADMNEQGDMVGTIIVDGIVHPAYKLANASQWEIIPVFPNSESSDVVTVYSISRNGRYVAGQMKAVPFVYDIQTQELTNLIPDNYVYGAGYAVNNSGTTVGWIDAAVTGTFRELGVMNKDLPALRILTEYAVPVNNHIWHIDDHGIVVGEVGLKPFRYNLNTHEFKIFDLPAGYRTGAFLASSNGIIVGYVQNMVMDRDAIIYHDSFGDQPKLIKDLLTEQGIPMTIPGGKLGGASAISENGDFIGGNEIGNGSVAPGWIIKLNGYFEDRACHIQVPSDIEIQTDLGETSAIVEYEVTSDCPTNQLVLVSGIASGGSFPIGITTVAYNSVNSDGNVVASASFKVNVKDAYCSPRFAAIVEPITKVVFGTINNQTSSYVTSLENEYFLDQSTDIEKGNTYTIQVAGNTNGVTETSQFAVFFDFNQDGIFNSDTEGFYIGSITGSTGVDGKSVSNSITIPTEALTGPTRMRVMKAYRLVPEDPCSQVYAYGQSEDYMVNVTEGTMSTSDWTASSVKVYPNPVKDILNIQSKTIVKAVKVYHLAGQEVMHVKTNQVNPQLNVSSLAKGVYLVKMDTEEGVVTQKMVKD